MNIVYVNNRNILKSYPVSNVDTFYTNTLMNTDVLSLTYGVDVSKMCGCSANSISDDTFKQLQIASGKKIDKCDNLEVYGLIGANKFYHIHDGRVDYITSDDDIKMCRNLYTLHVLDIVASSISRGVYEWGEFYDYNIESIDEIMKMYFFDNPIFTSNKMEIDSFIEDSINTYRIWCTTLAIIELFNGCKNVDTFLHDVMKDSKFNLRERYPFIDALGLELQKYEKRIKYAEERFNYHFSKAC